MKFSIVAFSLLVTLSACGNGEGPKSTNGITGINNRAAEDMAGQVPAGFPLPLYPGAKVTNVSKELLANGTIQTNVYTEIAPCLRLTSIGTYYAEKLKEGGWKIEPRDQQFQNDGFYQVVARKDDVVVQMNAHNREEANLTCIDLTKFGQPRATAP